LPAPREPAVIARLLLCLGFAVVVAIARVPVAQAHVDSWAVFEVHSGTIAQALLDGLDLSLERLPIQAHVRGSAFLGFLIAPLYALFGPTAFAMKLAPLLWHALTVGLLVYVLDRFTSRRAAITAGLLLLCAPPMMAKLSVLGFGSHMESSLPFVLALLPFGAITVERRIGAGWYGAFGLAAGMAHTWHLQALLPCLILAGLLVLHDPRRVVGRAGLAALAGATLGALPSLLFLGLGTMEGSWDLIKMILISEHRPEAVSRESTQLLGEQVGALSKLKVLLSGGFVQLLEFFEAPRGGRWLGPLYALLLLVAAGLALVQDRARLGWRALFRRDPEQSFATVLPWHLVALVLFFLASAATLYFTVRSTGWPNRRLSPLLFSLTVLAALGMAGGLRRPTPRGLWLALLIPLCAAGAWGQLGSVRATEANRLMNRGECYEWFTRHLWFHAGQDVEVALDTIREVDRGDPRFRSLRFRMSMGQLGLDEPDLAEREARLQATLPAERAVYRTTHLGRLLGEDLGRMGKPATWALVDTMSGVHRQAILHGIGLGLPSARPDFPDQWEAAMGILNKFFRMLDRQHVEAVSEGFGFARGFTFDPYMDSHLAMLADYADIGGPFAVPFFRGMGWGYRQRYVEPPDHVPEGLTILEHLPADMLAPFLDGYLAHRLPAEAAIMAAADG
jgi:hypothetical protein